jgi:hypothetical protein
MLDQSKRLKNPSNIKLIALKPIIKEKHQNDTSNNVNIMFMSESNILNTKTIFNQPAFKYEYTSPLSLTRSDVDIKKIDIKKPAKITEPLYIDVGLSNRTIMQRDYISKMSIDVLEKLSMENQKFIDLSNSITKEKTQTEYEICQTGQKIQDLYSSLKMEYPPILKQLAQKQISIATKNLAFQKDTLASSIETKANALKNIKKKFPKYDFTLNDEMTKYITETLHNKHIAQKNNAHLENLLCEKRINEYSKKFKKKHDYVVNRVIPFLSKDCNADGSNFEPCMARMFREYYLDILIKNAHLKHYMEICEHWINYDEIYDDDCFINRCTIKTDHTKRFELVSSIDIIKFENFDNFNLDSGECLCKV